LQFATGEDSVAVQKDVFFEDIGARSKSSGTFGTYGGGSGTSSVAGSVQQELADLDGMNRSKSDYALQRGKSKKEIKAEKTTMFYRDLTDALHNKVADFMVGVSAGDNGDDDELDELKRDLTSTIRALQDALMSEVQQRERGETVMQGQFERQAAKIQELERHCNDLADHVHHIMDGHGKLENKLEATLRNYSDELETKHGHQAAKHEEHAENLSNVHRDLTRIGAEVEDRHSNLVKSLEVSINDALGKTHAMIVAANKEGADTASDLAALRSEVDKRCSIMGDLIKQEAAAGERFRTAAQDCFDRMDKRFRSTASELQANRDGMDQICNSLCSVSKSWGSNIWSLRPPGSMISSENRSMDIRTGGT
jgi:DNA repair exonuclease SbcCD ATPase subunit